MNTTPELMYIQQELVENPVEHHRLIAERLGIAGKVVSMVCKQMGGQCTHGTKSKVIAAKKKRVDAARRGTEKRLEREKAEREAGLRPPVYEARNVTVNIDIEDWRVFKDKYKSQKISAAQRLGDMIREDLRS